MNNQEIEQRPKESPIPKSQLEFFEFVNHLREVKRQGWVDRKIKKDQESVAEHSYTVAVMVGMEARRRGLDTEKAMLMALVHDLPEILAGDRTPHQDAPKHKRAEAIQVWTPPSEEAKRDKRQKEEEALKIITQKLPVSFRAEIVELWQEYVAEETEVAKLVHQMDHIQLLQQAMIYVKQKPDFQVGSILPQGLASDDPQVKRVAKELEKLIGLVRDSEVPQEA